MIFYPQTPKEEPRYFISKHPSPNLSSKKFYRGGLGGSVGLAFAFNSGHDLRGSLNSAVCFSLSLPLPSLTCSVSNKSIFKKKFFFKYKCI
ncbi:unnamed protein product, partial [Gulo gulo]